MSVPAYDEGLDADQAAFFIKGALYEAPVGTAFPSALGDPGVGFRHTGFWSSDGLNENNSTSTGTVRGFQNNTLLAKPVTDGESTYGLTLVQTGAGNAEFYYGAEADPVTGAIVWSPARAAGRRNFILDKVATDPVTSLPIIERHMFEGEITARGQRATTYGNYTGYPLTITAYGDVTVLKSDWIPDAVDAWASTTAYVEDDRVELTGSEVLVALSAGTSGGTEPTAPGVGEVVVDGTVAWRQVA